MPGIENAAQTGGSVLADDAGDPAPPDKADAIAGREIGVIGRMARLIAVAFHDVSAKVGRGFGVVNPDAKTAVVPLQFFEGTGGMGAGCGQIAKGMKAIDMATPDQNSNFLAVFFGGV